MMAARAKVDLSKEGHGQRCSVQTQLSNQCAYTCVCVHTHGCLLPPSLQGFVAEALINSQPPLTLQRASISQHTLFPQIPEPSLKKKAHSAFFLFSSVGPFIHIYVHQSVWLFLSLPFQNYLLTFGLSIVFLPLLQSTPSGY